MQVNVKLFGRLSENVPNYDSDNGALIELQDGGGVNELFDALNISKSQGCVVVMDGRIMGPDDKLKENASVDVLEALQGG